jgi:hypothetical protein
MRPFGAFALVAWLALCVPTQAQESWDLARCRRLLTEETANAGHACTPEHLAADLAKLREPFGQAWNDPGAIQVLQAQAEQGWLEVMRVSGEKVRQSHANLKKAHEKLEADAKEFESRRIKISVTVDCRASDLRSRIMSFVLAELRRLGDVDVVDAGPEYLMSIVALATENKAGHETGYAASVVVTRPLGGMDALLADVRPESRNNVNAALKGEVRPISHQLLVGSMDGLRGALETLVASFDAETLQGERKMFRELADLLRKEAAEPITPK